MRLLHVTDLHAGYGRAEVLHGLNFCIDDGEVVVVLGSNGAGKTTTMRALTGLIPCRGTIEFGGQQLAGLRPDQIVAHGVCLVPQGRGTFPKLTVQENMRVGAARRTDRNAIESDMDRWMARFPVLAARATQTAGTLSGGEQQILALARALMGKPRLLLCDEPSLGLAPLVVREVFSVLDELNRESGMAMLVVEQNAELALDLAQRAYLLEVGDIVNEGSAQSLRQSDAVRRAYLGY
jgi:branched-chain amino acid transport system ATP-binding protein